MRVLYSWYGGHVDNSPSSNMLSLWLALAAVDSEFEPLHVPRAFGEPASDVKIADFGDNFEFGLATAPAHVEDQLDDAWLAFA